MFCPPVHHLDPLSIHIRILISESAFFLHTPGFVVAFEISAPEILKMQVLECMANDLFHALRYEALSPERHADPVTDLCFSVRQSDVALLSYHQAYAPYRLTIFFQADSISLRRS